MNKMEIYKALNEITSHTSCMDMDRIVDWIWENKEKLTEGNERS
jgi:hypothetical protein